MPDYPINELLTRTLALDEMKRLSDAFFDAKMKGDRKLAYDISVARKELRDKYFKVVK